MGTVLELVEMNYILSLRRERSGAKNEMHRSGSNAREKKTRMKLN